jgi:hypothetical protein
MHQVDALMIRRIMYDDMYLYVYQVDTLYDQVDHVW